MPKAERLKEKIAELDVAYKAAKENGASREELLAIDDASVALYVQYLDALDAE